MYNKFEFMHIDESNEFFDLSEHNLIEMNEKNKQTKKNTILGNWK